MLIAAQDEIAQFVSLLFRYAEPGTYVSLRAFDQHDRGKPPVLIHAVEVRGDMSGVITAATKAAERAANSDSPSVFAPPVATFNNRNTARSADVACGVALTVEMDAGDTKVARSKLEVLLGPVTLAVASGGEWIDPDTGEIHNKTHLHWRLSEPTLTPADHALLQEARRLAALYAGGDPTAAPPAHPLRWPGSWNRKGKPRLAMIQAGNPAAEVHLADALEKLQEAIEQAGLGSIETGPRVSGEAQAPIAIITSALAALSNADAHWDEWNRIGMATYRASGGSQAGLDAWIDWSMKSPKYVAGACQDRWQHYGTSPPSRIGAGTLFFMAAADGWQRPRQDREPPPAIEDAGYWHSLEQAAAMSPHDWSDLERRESGESIPASSAAVSAAGPDLLWQVMQSWDETSIPKRPWIAKGYFMRGAVTVISGHGSAGKSSLVVAMSVALTIGMQFGNMRPDGFFRAMNYNVEDDEYEQKRRYSGMFRAFGISYAETGDRLALLGPKRVGTLLTLGRDGGLLLNTPVMDRLEAYVREFKPDVLFMDPLVELHSAEENDNTAIRAVMARFRALAADHNCAVVLLHHNRKGAAAPGDPDTMRGASSIVGAARIVLTLSVMTDDEAKSLGLSETSRRFYSRLDGAKSNYAPIGEAEWFERSEQVLDNQDATVVVWPWKPPNMAPSGDTIQRALAAIAAGSTAGPWSPRMSDDPRSFRTLCSRLNVDGHAAQKALLDDLLRHHGVTVGEVTRDGKAKSDTIKGLRTADGAPHTAQWFTP